MKIAVIQQYGWRGIKLRCSIHHVYIPQQARAQGHRGVRTQVEEREAAETRRVAGPLRLTSWRSISEYNFLFREACHRIVKFPKNFVCCVFRRDG